jgi:RNA polymerase sigma factor for flagellar operon FliA
MTSQDLVIENLPLAAKIANGISRRLPRHIDPQDLRQEASLGLLRAAARYDGAGNVQFGAYARRRISGAVLDSPREDDHLSRRTRRHMKAEGADDYSFPLQMTAPDALPGNAPAPDQCAAEAERRRLLDAGIATLPARLQSVVRAYYDGEQTMREISHTLGVNQGRVSQLHARAIGMLRTHFQVQGVSEL